MADKRVKKPSLRDIRKMQSVEVEPVAEAKIEKTIAKSEVKTSKPEVETVGLDKGKRKSPRINITLSRHTYVALKAVIDEQQDKGINASMSGFIDDLIREKLELD